MNVREKIIAYNQVVQFLEWYDIGKPKNKSFRALDEHINNVLVKYLSAMRADFRKNNSWRYKGDYRPVMDNSYEVCKTWLTFKKWVEKNYNKKP